MPEEQTRQRREETMRVLLARAVLYGVLAGTVAAVYGVIVVGLGWAVGTRGRPNTTLAIVATIVVAVAFQRVRPRAARAAHRLAYGERVTPQEAMERFSRRIAATGTPEEVLAHMAQEVADGTGAARADVWLRVGDMLAPAARWPVSAPMPAEISLEGDGVPEAGEADRAIPVRHRGELLGAITVAKRPGEPMSAAEDRLLLDLASQAGLVLRNVRLTAELEARLEQIAAQAIALRASRQRIVAAQDRERRRIANDIHDGAQQHLVALAVHLGMAKKAVAGDAETGREVLTELRRVTREAIGTLADLSRGIYPPLLVERGLAEAMRMQAAALRGSVEVERLGRYAAELEAAIYFTCNEALQNAAKHAPDSGITVRLAEREGALVFSVADDGPGFDVAAAGGGSGLQNMSDRVAALGGALEVRSAPGAGTTVAGHIPVRAAGGTS